ncbi:MAG: TRAP transporter large permease, partial [Syntrophaceae bacterium]|nr:TRAP transporter large permease [Syntrophaceae bacterium]
MFELHYGWIAFFVFLAITALIATKMPVAICFMTVGLFGFTFLLNKPVLIELGPTIWSMLDSFPLTSVVLFVLMGEFMMQGGLSRELYSTTEKWIYRLPGGLAQVNITACTIFAAISGSSVSTAATMGVLAGPEMEKRGYDNRLTYGTLAAGATLGILIPPSIPLIIYGALTGTSVGRLFMAGVIPGILLTVLFMTITAVWALKSPKIAPAAYATVSWKERWNSLTGFLPTAMIIIAVLGGIYGGVVTPTEAACVGALASFIILLVRRRVTKDLLKKSFLSTIAISSMSYMLIAGSSLINFIFNYLRAPAMLSETVATMALSPLAVFICMCIMYLILGMFIDGISMVVLTAATVCPLMTALGFDAIWLGIVIVLLVEIALITPPVGVNLFILMGISSEKVTFVQICLGALPYVAMLLLMIALIYIFPQIALWLPNTM